MLMVPFAQRLQRLRYDTWAEFQWDVAMRSYVPADASGVSGRTMTGTSVWFADLNEHSSK
eukprot:COSAG06_NODE_42846_length_377_cov_68.794964_1_plen_59_part_10